MKKLGIATIIITSIFILMGCSSKQNATASLKVTEENKSYLEEYDMSLQVYFDQMTSIFKSFNNSLDGLYTEQYSREQFAKSMKDNIEISNTLVSDVESLDVEPELFENHQNLIALINRSHGLLLTAIDMANTEENEIDKNYLRTEYQEIKTNQASINNEWKILRKSLETSDGETPQ
ncbi:hypothetical protein [Cytobacillus oceanisediminis]|uniref:hypothetical protein n=1 Tax=Cytobacillus oceanisediminis TaxID=665099 RepID=UPI00204219E7|nr:hypothetical protein [Cytobacillus oceanisediminis]MCM3393245.1 hypothetical protein [Cytobacillus oceanisediminis]